MNMILNSKQSSRRAVQHSQAPLDKTDKNTCCTCSALCSEQLDVHVPVSTTFFQHHMVKAKHPRTTSMYTQRSREKAQFRKRRKTPALKFVREKKHYGKTLASHPVGSHLKSLALIYNRGTPPSL